MLDLNGDAKPDMVVSENCAGDVSTGANQWRLHDNIGTGFAAEASNWSLPSYGVDINGEPLFRLLADAHTCPDNGVLRYHSYGSPTADGVRALVRCGLAHDHPRVLAARAWLAISADTSGGGVVFEGEVPDTVEHNWKGYLEDRRPASNADPYRVTARIVETVREAHNKAVNN